MASGHSGVWGDVQALAGVEGQVASTLTAASDEIAHSECFDPEDRAEIYAIIEAISADSKAHQQALLMLGRQLGEGHADA